MSLGSVAGVFSRYFIVGFFLPAFFVLVGLGQALGDKFRPDVYVDASSGVQIAIIGGTALLIGLLLVGLHYPVLRFFEGYPLRAYGKHLPLKPVYELLMWRQRSRFTRLSARTEFVDRWRVDRRFATDDPNLMLPTGFGNAICAFERHSFIRWHLNGIAVWPHIENLLSSQEAQVLADTKGDVAFFVNVSLLSALSGLAVAADRVIHDSALSILLCLIPFSLSVIAYHWATGAAIRWGEVVRACIDLHRRELYAKLGLRTPRDFSDERQIAWRLNTALLVGGHLCDDVADVPALNHQGVVTLEIAEGPNKEVSNAD
jgi:hypothetical protein